MTSYEFNMWRFSLCNDWLDIILARFMPFNIFDMIYECNTDISLHGDAISATRDIPFSPNNINRYISLILVSFSKVGEKQIREGLNYSNYINV